MKHWLLVLFILLVQETVTLNGLLVKAHEGEYSLWLIAIFFIIFTILDIVIGHFLGKFVRLTVVSYWATAPSLLQSERCVQRLAATEIFSERIAHKRDQLARRPVVRVGANDKQSH